MNPLDLTSLAQTTLTRLPLPSMSTLLELTVCGIVCLLASLHFARSKRKGGMGALLVLGLMAIGFALPFLRATSSGERTHDITASPTGRTELATSRTVADTGAIDSSNAKPDYAHVLTVGEHEIVVSLDSEEPAEAWAAVTRKASRIHPALGRLSPSLLGSLLAAAAIAALMFIGYVALDAGTRGQFTWPLRVLTTLAFAALITAVAALRHAL